MFLFVDVFLFFSLRPSHMSETFTYGSAQVKEDNKTKLSFIEDTSGPCAFSLFTGCSCDVHGLEIASLYHGNSQSTRSGKVTERKHQITEVHIILERQHKSPLHLFFVKLFPHVIT